ncbi:MAG: hypothetical protein JST04_01110 [Bdellovibrionales bacterium]|nr:hypothetical protein [Bdellovibrionales bacterium]
MRDLGPDQFKNIDRSALERLIRTVDLSSEPSLYLYDSALKKKVAKCAINFPKKNRIVVSQECWDAIGGNWVEKITIALHEYFSFLNVERDQSPYSSAIALELLTRVNIDRSVGTYRTPDRRIYYSNGAGAYCAFANYSDYLKFTEVFRALQFQNVYQMPFAMRYDGACRSRGVTMPRHWGHGGDLGQGFYRLHNGTIYYSNGLGEVCGFTSWEHYARHAPAGTKWKALNSLPENLRLAGNCEE